MLQYVPRRDQTLAAGAPGRPEASARQPVGIQEAVAGASPLRAYQDLVVGSRRLGRLMLYELVMLASSWVPGALGLLLRRR